MNAKRRKILKDRYRSFVKEARAVMKSARVMKMADFPQHRRTNCLRHSLAVAYISCKLGDKLHMKYDKFSTIRGALLHDYFLYNRSAAPKNYPLHGIRHPRVALKNAMADFMLNPIEKDIIKRHMFPLTITPPKYKESYLVSISDKICAVYECFSRKPYKKMLSDFKKISRL